MKRLTVALVGLVAVFNPLESLSKSKFTPFETPVTANHQHHVALAQAAVATGVEFRINPPMCDREQALGWYWAFENELVVCQKNKMIGSSAEVDWVDEDYDTLRHEAHHLVQDCMARENRDGHLGAVYEDPIALSKEVLGNSAMSQIAYVYRDRNDHTIVMEFEAFSVARMNDPLEQVEDIKRYCM